MDIANLEFPDPSLDDILSVLTILRSTVLKLKDIQDQKDIQLSAALSDYKELRSINETLKNESDRNAKSFLRKDTIIDIIREMVRDSSINNKIKAIKYLREEVSMGLREAKDFVESIQDENK